MTPNRIWTVSAAIGVLMTLACSTSFNIPGIWRGLPLGILVMMMAANALSMTYGPRGIAPAPILRERREVERG